MCTNSIGGGIMSASGVGKNFQNINEKSISIQVTGKY
jgi:hypothetical protein